ncbi:hypothetical protein [Evansella tamaricis]|uniref:Uncharacterized protein n=1 Tax=Evansella tamaricis TaxID=2069301 RepID=A0ABS6JFH0_9BACI|nr:hypothetical protein [Evansella tamaricis]MBU9711083.1 hypothetical protein [Evansella tamaricis]
MEQMSLFDQLDEKQIMIENYLEQPIEKYTVQKERGTHFIAYVLTKDNIFDVIISNDILATSQVLMEYNRNKISDRLINRIFNNKKTAPLGTVSLDLL